MENLKIFINKERKTTVECSRIADYTALSKYQAITSSHSFYDLHLTLDDLIETLMNEYESDGKKISSITFYFSIEFLSIDYTDKNNINGFMSTNVDVKFIVEPSLIELLCAITGHWDEDANFTQIQLSNLYYSEALKAYC